MIDLENLLTDDEHGGLNRLKLQKYVYLAQSCMQNNFGYEYNFIETDRIHQGLQITTKKK
jgi:uncharacterized protein YwgA